MNSLKTFLNLGMPGRMSYTGYISLIETLLGEGKTTGENHSQLLLDFTRLNLTRMKRIKKTFEPTEALSTRVKQLPAQDWLIITEAWCGDAAQSLPMMQGLADLNPQINTHYILRDMHPEIMDLFLTDGGRGIPILLAIDKTRNIIFKWGPRPDEAQQLVRDYKAQPEPKPDYLSFANDIQKWYAKDRGESFQSELFKLLSTVV